MATFLATYVWVSGRRYASPILATTSAGRARDDDRDVAATIQTSGDALRPPSELRWPCSILDQVVWDENRGCGRRRKGQRKRRRRRTGRAAHAALRALALRATALATLTRLACASSGPTGADPPLRSALLRSALLRSALLFSDALPYRAPSAPPQRVSRVSHCTLTSPPLPLPPPPLLLSLSLNTPPSSKPSFRDQQARSSRALFRALRQSSYSPYSPRLAIRYRILTSLAKIELCSGSSSVK